MQKIFFTILSLFLILTAYSSETEPNKEFIIHISFSKEVSQQNLDGRLLLMFSNNRFSSTKDPVLKY